jgi:hypothetical protein
MHRVRVRHDRMTRGATDEEQHPSGALSTRIPIASRRTHGWVEENARSSGSTRAHSRAHATARAPTPTQEDERSEHSEHRGDCVVLRVVAHAARARARHAHAEAVTPARQARVVGRAIGSRRARCSLSGRSVRARVAKLRAHRPGRCVRWARVRRTQGVPAPAGVLEVRALCACIEWGRVRTREGYACVGARGRVRTRREQHGEDHG